MAYHITDQTFEPRRMTYPTMCGLVVTPGDLTRGTSLTACPKCSAKFMAKHLESNPNGYRLGERERPNQRGGLGEDLHFKSLYPILNDEGDIVGAIAIRPGLQESWAIYPLVSRYVFGFMRRDTGEGNLPPPIVSGRCARVTETAEPKGREPYTFERDANGYPSKERALCDVPKMVAQGHLRTAKDILAEDTANRAKTLAEKAEQQAEKAVIMRERAERQAQREADLATIKIAFNDMLSRQESGLSNYEKGALLKAAVLLEIPVAG